MSRCSKHSTKLGHFNLKTEQWEAGEGGWHHRGSGPGCTELGSKMQWEEAGEGQPLTSDSLRVLFPALPPTGCTCTLYKFWTFLRFGFISEGGSSWGPPQMGYQDSVNKCLLGPSLELGTELLSCYFWHNNTRVLMPGKGWVPGI